MEIRDYSACITLDLWKKNWYAEIQWAWTLGNDWPLNLGKGKIHWFQWIPWKLRSLTQVQSSHTWFWNFNTEQKKKNDSGQLWVVLVKLWSLFWDREHSQSLDFVKKCKQRFGSICGACAVYTAHLSLIVNFESSKHSHSMEVFQHLTPSQSSPHILTMSLIT